jgi:stage II sporulation protein D
LKGSVKNPLAANGNSLASRRPRMLCRSTVVACSLLAVLAAVPSATPAPAPPVSPGTPTFVISGRGWGHGVGMSQYGALGFAQRGWGYARIVAHY